MSDAPLWVRPQLWWRVVIVLCGASGLLLGDPAIAYYTCQSNLLTLGYFACVVYWMIRRRTTDPPRPGSAARSSSPS
ncbi:hypothetical protein AB0M20_02305 [Actinoplanes sp. NPDC051633]|uniref:hypothetical protein n=1 Tax=Actinoplanes sp. NPDC051633 TaxID=3155670 RepID=UPI0034225DEC